MTKLMSVLAVLVVLPAPLDPDLDKAAAAAGAMTAYTGKVTVTLTGQNSGTTTMEIHVQPDSAVHIKCGDADYYRKGETLIRKDGDAWKTFETPARGDGKLDKATIELIALKHMKLPHEALKELAAKVGEVKKEASDGGPILTAPLNPEGAREFGSVMNKKGKGDAVGKKKDPLEYSGSIKIWLDAEGAMTKIEVTAQGKGTIKDRAVDYTKTTIIELCEVGKTKFEVPEDARKALGIETPKTEEPKKEDPK